MMDVAHANCLQSARRSRTLAISILASLIFCLIASARAQTGGQDSRADPIDSPRLAALARDISKDHVALEKFWQEVRGKSPLVEPVTEGGDYLVTYLWRGHQSADRVILFGGVPTGGLKLLSRLPQTDLWYRTERVPRDARYGYGFVEQGAGTTPGVQLDPLNARTYGEQSVVELPGAPPQPWSNKIEGVPAGKLEAFKIKSTSLASERNVTVYTPPGYAPHGEEVGLLVSFDGESSGGDLVGFNPLPTPVILDNLLAAKRIAPMIAVFVESGETRDRDLGCYRPFADFVAKELLPWVHARYRVSRDPRRTIVSGFSRGGLGATYAAFTHPESFGNVLALSGAFWWYPEADRDARAPRMERQRLALDRERGWLTRQFVASPRLPVRFYIEAGKFEESILPESRRLRDVLQAKGYDVIYHEQTGDHDYIVWRGSLAEGLLALVGTKVAK
jgi:enterochelin esterase family protein